MLKQRLEKCSSNFNLVFPSLNDRRGIKDEQHEFVADDYLLHEWQQVLSVVNPEAVHLWRGKARQVD